MRLHRLLLDGHRSVELLEFDVGPFTVLFGKNNAGKTNILETVYGLFAPDDERVIRRTHAERPSSPSGAMCVELEPGLSFDDRVLAAVVDNSPRVGRPKVAFTNGGVLAGDLDAYYEEELGAVYPGNWREDVQEAP